MSGTQVPFQPQPFYCEENIWKLCQHPDFQGGEVIFIASYGDYFPMLHQQGSQQPDLPIFWDYHVILQKEDTIYDFNSTLGFATEASKYFSQSFVDAALLSPLQIPMLRRIPAIEFVAVFKSDRRHMKSQTGWSAPPPEWPLISESESNLSQFVNMQDLTFGEVIATA